MTKWLAAGLVLSGLLIAAACGGGDDVASTTPTRAPTLTAAPTLVAAPTLAQYYAEQQTILDEFLPRFKALATKYPRAFKDDVQQTKDDYSEYVPLWDSADDRFNALDAMKIPVEVHDLVTESDALSAEMSTIDHARLARLLLATTYPQVDAIFKTGADAKWDAHSVRYQEICASLGSVAAANGIAYDVSKYCSN
jgi:hypothetical protein